MTQPTTIELAELLPAEMLDRLQAEAERQQLPLPNLVREAIAAYLHDDEYEDTPDEEILSSLQQSLTEVLKGKTRPAREIIAEIRRELAENGDES
jgi:predicted DNA-binding protein